MSQHARVAALIADRRLCLDCIAEQTRTSILDTDTALTAIAQRVPRSLCRTCGKIRMTYSLI